MRKWEDVRGTFLNHFFKELERKSIIAFKDNESERSQNLSPELTHAIRESRIAVVVFSKNYSSSTWCLNELLQVYECYQSMDLPVIPIFYGLDPSHVRKQTGEFGKNFEKTCRNKTEACVYQWRRALCDVSNFLGYHSPNWANEATMIEQVANDVLFKLNLTPSSDFPEFVGIEDHIAAMNSVDKR
ncbi:hypothetical protein AXX17_AT5G44950 [Arabidopsis thaliana]|uniref:TIR domain-containing protein n=1 Tax=Arabidopsis thaliana TaxID=3702 RepID=A0A178UMF5_ARATH|nr:hypothetical protein AXX17_AT5G44950 [Arabidopsis thaliana]